MKSLILHQHEVMELGRAGEVEILRRIKWPVRSVRYAGTRKIYQTLSQVAIDLNYPEGRKHPHETVDCPYGRHGEMRWVRESFGLSHQADDINCREQVIVYRAGHPYTITDAGVDELKRCKNGELIEPNHFVPKPLRWYPSTQMPRWASRYTVKVLAVGVAEVEDVGFWFLQLRRVEP